MQAGSTYAAIVGAVIANKRESLKMPQGDLAEHVGVGQPALSRIEKGESALTIDQLARAAQKLGTSPSALLAEADNTALTMIEQNLLVSYEKPKRSAGKVSTKGLLLLGSTALAAVIYAANRREPKSPD